VSYIFDLNEKLSKPNIDEIKRNILSFDIFNRQENGKFNYLSSTYIPVQYTNVKAIQKILCKPGVNKNDRNSLVVNKYYRNPSNKVRRKLEYLKYPVNVIVDIDFKTKEQLNQYNLDTGNNFNSPEEAAEFIYNQFVNDEHFYYLDLSTSEKGVKGVIGFISSQFKELMQSGYFDKYDPYQYKGKSKEQLEKYHNDHANIIRELHNDNFYASLKFLKRFNLKYHKDKVIDYIDSAMKTATTPTFSSNGTNFMINPDYELSYYDSPPNTSLTPSLKPSLKITITPNQLRTKNDDWFYQFIEYIKKSNNETQLNFEKKCQNMLSHFGEEHNKLMFTLIHTTDDVRRFFYEKWLIYGQESGVKDRVKNINDWNKEIEKYRTTERTNITQSLQSLFKDIMPPINIMNRENNTDFFNNRYDTILYLNDNENVSVLQKDLDILINKYKKIILKSAAGTGKTTYLLRLLYRMILNNKPGIKIVVIPKNSLLRQLKYKLLNDLNDEGNKYYHGMKIVENFGGKTALRKDLTDTCVVLSSTPKMNIFNDRHIDFIFIDEIHNLVSYGKEILSYITNADKEIYVSATPEPYLIGENLNDYHYINVEKKNKTKKSIKIYSTKYRQSLLFNHIDENRKQLILLNNVDRTKKLIDDIKEKKNIEFHQLYSSNKNDETNIILNKEKLIHTHYFITNFMIDGINFNNEEWDDIFIYHNINNNIFDYYQLSERFRLVENMNIILFTNEMDDYLDEINFKDLNRDFNKSVKFYQNIADELNNKYSTYEEIETEKVNNIIQDNNDKYIVNVDGIKLDRFKMFNSLCHKYKNVLSQSLEYYFNVSEHFPVSNEFSYEKNYELENMKIWTKYIDSIITYLGNYLINYDDKLDYPSILMNLSSHDELNDNVEYNKVFYDKKIKQLYQCVIYKMDFNYTLETDITFNKILKKYKVNKITESVKEKLPPISQYKQDKYELMIDIIMNKYPNYIIDKDGKKYIDMDDFIELLKRYDVRQHFKTLDDRYMFYFPRDEDGDFIRDGEMSLKTFIDSLNVIEYKRKKINGIRKRYLMIKDDIKLPKRKKFNGISFD